MPGCNPCGPGECHLQAVRRSQIDHCERQVTWITAERPDGALANIFVIAGMPGIRGKGSQKCKLALTDNALRVVAVGADDATDSAVVIRNRAVRECVVGFFGIPVALHDEQLGFEVGSLLPAHCGIEERTDVAPDLAPHLRDRASQRPGMLATDDGFVGVVVKIGEIAAPADPDRLAGGQHDPQGHAQILGPAMWWADRRVRPVEFPNALP